MSLPTACRDSVLSLSSAAVNFGLRGLAGNGVAESFQEPLKSGDAFTERRDVVMHLLAKCVEFRAKVAHFSAEFRAKVAHFSAEYRAKVADFSA